MKKNTEWQQRKDLDGDQPEGRGEEQRQGDAQHCRHSEATGCVQRGFHLPGNVAHEERKELDMKYVSDQMKK